MPLTFRIVEDVVEAENLWKAFSAHPTIYGAWEFRALFHKHHQNKLAFYVGYENDSIIGVLPLQHSHEGKHLEFFGGTYMEDNRLLIKPGHETSIPEFYAAVKQPAKLEAIIGDDTFTAALSVQDYKYVLPLVDFTTFDEYLENRLEGRSKKKLRATIRKVESEITITDNDMADLELLFAYNMERFGSHSSFVDRPFHKEIFRDLFKLPYQFFLQTFIANGVKQGVSLGVLYNGVYEFFNVGIKNDALPELSTFVTMKNVEKAIISKATMFDAFMGSYGWKEHWKLDKIAQHIFVAGL